MKKYLIIQKIMFTIFILAAVSIFIYALGFMTNYEAFQYIGYVYSANEPLYNFHHNVLIPFNNVIFYVSVVGLIMIIVIFAAKLNKYLPDKINLIMGLIATIPLLFCSLYGLLNLSSMKSEYNTFDFSYVATELYAEYTPSTLAFDIGNILYVLVLVLMLIYILSLVFSYIYRKRVENNG